MWRFLILVYLSITCTNAQNERNQRPFDNGHGWDIRLAVPGEPGNDYPVLNSIPRTSFTCSGKEPGYYADVETNCQVFRVCTLGSTYGFQSFLCPNGTLFNQAVFVCDWWMHVNCAKTRDLISKNNDQFGKLKLGPQFMSDIKKMITHPMRNPYDKSFIKTNLISMQEYRPPSGQLYNNAFLRNLEKKTNDVFVKTEQSPKNFFNDIYSTADISFAASTPDTRYIQNYNSFQKQTQNVLSLRQQQAGRLLNSPFLISNSHGGQSSHINNKTTTFRNSQNSPHGNSHIQTYQNKNLHRDKQTTFGIEFSKQQLNQRFGQNHHLYIPESTQAQLSKDIVTQGERETKQNLVSSEIKPGLITKTLAFRRIVKDPKDGTPKSRITFKTWIVRPSKSSKLVADTTPYTYSKPSYTEEKTSDNTISNLNSIPIRSTPIPVVENERVLYKYNTPTVLSNQIITPVKEISNSRESSTTSRISNKPTLPTKSPLIYLAPTTFKPTYTNQITPIQNIRQLSRQYLLPTNIDYGQLVASGSSPTPLFKVPLQSEKSDSTLTINKQSLINTNHNNIAFSDILTKEKLDISVNDIVKDTDQILKTASPETVFPFQKNTQLLEDPSKKYLPPETEPKSTESEQQSAEKLTLHSPPPLPKSSRLVATLSPNLEPPIETEYFNQTDNKISNLPYYKKPLLPPNTIERTVSLKITIPENIAKHLFRKNNDHDLNNLEILNAGNSNYLVLTNNLADNADTKFVPIGKLIQNNLSNISDSQDLVFSLLADSINTAKEYNNVARQHLVTPTPSQPQNQNIVQDELGRISKDVTQLTLAKFSESNFSASTKPTIASPIDQTLPNIFSGNTNYLNNFTRNQHFTQQPNQSAQPNILLSGKNHRNQIDSSENIKNAIPDILTNNGKIYSGQLYQFPVPDVTRHIYNSPNPSISNFILSNSFLSSNTDNQQSNTEVEIIPSQSIPIDSFQNIAQADIISDQGNSANIFIDDFEKPINGITAQVHDNIIGTLPHPSDNDKQIQYKKDQSYYFYSHFNQNNDISADVDSNENTAYPYNPIPSPPSSFQLLPSVGYKLEGEKEKEKFLNIFQINEYGNRKPKNDNGNINFNRRQDISADVDFTVVHPTSSSKLQRLNYLNTLYDGPTSYSASQASVGSLDNKQNGQTDSFNAKLEKFDPYDKGYGYPKPNSPSKRFLF